MESADGAPAIEVGEQSQQPDEQNRIPPSSSQATETQTSIIEPVHGREPRRSERIRRPPPRADEEVSYASRLYIEVDDNGM